MEKKQERSRYGPAQGLWKSVELEASVLFSKKTKVLVSARDLYKLLLQFERSVAFLRAAREKIDEALRVCDELLVEEQEEEP